MEIAELAFARPEPATTDCPVGSTQTSIPTTWSIADDNSLDLDQRIKQVAN